MTSAAVRLVSALLTTFGAILVGFMCVRLRLINPAAGEMKAMSFFVGKFAFPLLIFKTVATANLQGLTWSVVLSCNIAKFGAFMLAFGLCYLLNRQAANRLLTSTVFAYFVVASNDFAIGFPVMDALYPLSEHPENMSSYLAINSVLVIAIFTPVVLVLLGIGSQSGGEGGLDRSFFLELACTIFLNPMIVCTIAGVIWQLVYPGDATAGFPLFMQQFLDVATAPFTMLALFCTGATLKTFKLSIWPFVLVALKVLFCSHMGATLSSFVLPDGSSHKKDFVNFSLLYGSIPTSPAPLIFSDQFCPESSELIATAVILGTIASAPNMLLSSVLFAGGESIQKLIFDLIGVVDMVNMFSVAALVAILFVGRRWLKSAPMDLVICYGSATGVYLMSKLAISGSDCTNPDSYIQRQWIASKHDFFLPTVGAIIFAISQNMCRLLSITVLLWRALDWPQSRTTLAMVASGIVAVASGLVVPPNTLDAVCDLPELATWRSPCWTLFLLICTIAIFAYPSFKSKASTDNALLEEDADAPEETNPPAAGFLLTGLSPPCKQHKMHSTAVALGTCLILRLSIQFVDDIVVAWNGKGALADVPAIGQMLILDTILEHSQACFLLMLVFLGDDFKPLAARIFQDWSGKPATEELSPDEVKFVHSKLEERLSARMEPRRFLCWSYAPCVRGDHIVDSVVEESLATYRDQGVEVAMNLLKHGYISQVDGYTHFQDADSVWYYTKQNEVALQQAQAKTKRRKSLMVQPAFEEAPESSLGEASGSQTRPRSRSLADVGIPSMQLTTRRRSIKELLVA